MKLSQKFAVGALAVGAAVGLSGCATTYGEDKIHESLRGVWHCESEKLGAKISFDTKGMIEETGEGALSDPAHTEVTQLDTGLRVKLYNKDGWICTPPNGVSPLHFPEQG
jgi:hypothetical protein